MASSIEQQSAISGAVKCGEFLHQLSNCQPLKTDCAQWSLVGLYAFRKMSPSLRHATQSKNGRPNWQQAALQQYRYTVTNSAQLAPHKLLAASSTTAVPLHCH